MSKRTLSPNGYMSSCYINSHRSTIVWYNVGSNVIPRATKKRRYGKFFILTLYFIYHFFLFFLLLLIAVIFIIYSVRISYISEINLKLSIIIIIVVVAIDANWFLFLLFGLNFFVGLNWWHVWILFFLLQPVTQIKSLRNKWLYFLLLCFYYLLFFWFITGFIYVFVVFCV